MLNLVCLSLSNQHQNTVWQVNKPCWPAKMAPGLVAVVTCQENTATISYQRFHVFCICCCKPSLIPAYPLTLTNYGLLHYRVSKLILNSHFTKLSLLVSFLLNHFAILRRAWQSYWYYDCILDITYYIAIRIISICCNLFREAQAHSPLPLSILPSVYEHINILVWFANMPRTRKSLLTWLPAHFLNQCWFISSTVMK